MQRKRYIIQILTLLLLLPVAVEAQNVKFSNYREVKNYLKNDKQSAAEALVRKLGAKDSIEKYYLSGMVCQHAYEKLNINLFYGSKVDTAQTFKTLYSMYENYMNCYPAVKRVDQHLKPMMQAIRSHQENVRIGGNYFITHQNYAEALKCYQMILRLNDEQIISTPDSLLNAVYSNSVIAAGLSQNFDLVVSLAHKAHATDHDSEDIDLQLCDALRRTQRTGEWIEALKTGIEHHPQQFTFYGQLIDYYLKENHSTDAMALADDLVSHDSGNYINCFVKGYVCQQTQDIDGALEWLNKAYALNADYAPVLASLGFCTVKKAEAVENAIDHFPFTPEEKEQIQGIYREAEILLERSRRLSPDDKENWASLLWKVYYKLNEGEKLDEIEQLL